MTFKNLTFVRKISAIISIIFCKDYCLIVDKKKVGNTTKVLIDWTMADQRVNEHCFYLHKFIEDGGSEGYENLKAAQEIINKQH